MIIRLTTAKGIDRRALFPLAKLIHSYLQTNPCTKAVEIGINDIRFTKGIFSSSERIKYIPYQIVCRDGMIYFEGENSPNAVKDDLFTLIVNVLYRLQPGYMCKI